MTVLFVFMWPISAATPALFLVFAAGVKMARLTWGAPDVVDCQIGDSGIQFHQKGEWLANSSTATQYSDFGSLIDESAELGASISTIGECWGLAYPLSSLREGPSLARSKELT